MKIETGVFKATGLRSIIIDGCVRATGCYLFAFLCLSLLLSYLFFPTPARADGPVPLSETAGWIEPVAQGSLSNGAWGDMDSDGDLDFVVGSHDQIHVYLNHGVAANGLPTLTRQALSLPTGDTSKDIALGDIDGDGDLDVAYGKLYSGGTIYLNEGSVDGQVKLGASNWHEPPAGSDANGSLENTAAVALADVDGDGKLDLTTGNAIHVKPSGLLRLYLNRTPAGGSVQMTPAFTITGNIKSVAWGDVDRDGDLDLATGGDFDWRLYINDSGIISTTPVISRADNAFNDGFTDVGWGDIDGDGFLELAVARFWAPSEVFSFEQTGGRWQANRVWFDPDAPTNRAGSVALAWGDVDNDGDADLAVDYGEDPDRVYLNVGGRLQSGASWATDTTFGGQGLAWADVNGDGNLDLTTFGNSSITAFLNRGGGLPTTPGVSAPGKTSTTASMAWGDIDNDGRPELAVGAYANTFPLNHGSGPLAQNIAAPNFIYRFQNGKLEKDSAAWSPTRQHRTNAVAWGDVNSDGWLDLAVANAPQQPRITDMFRTSVITDGWNEIYLNNQGTLAATPAFTIGSGAEETTALAWGDIDGDGHLDLATANFDGPTQVYLNNSGAIQEPPTWILPPGKTVSLAFGDIDNDGDLDLAVAKHQPDNVIEIHRNQGGQLATRPNTIINSAKPWSVAFGDIDGDGYLDLAVGADAGPNKVYPNHDGIIQPTPVWLSGDADFASKITLGDVNGDGFLDLAASNGPDFFVAKQSKLYLNAFGQLNPAASWVTDNNYFAGAAAWGDANGDGRLDLALGNGGDSFDFGVQQPPQPRPDILFLNQQRSDFLSAGSPTIALTTPGLAPADNYALPTVRTEATIPVTFTLSGAANTVVRQVRAYYSPNGGGQWFPAIHRDTLTNAVGPLPVDTFVTSATFANTYVFPWDVRRSGFFGQSDNMVFRLEAYPGYTPTRNSIAGSFQHAYAATHSFPFRVRGTQVQVISGTTPVSGALVYRLPAGESVGGQALRGLTPFTTDQNGYLQGRGQIAPGDQLLALAPQSLPADYRARYGNTLAYYLTNGQPTANGLKATTVSGDGVQQLVVSPDHPLLLFDLDVSLEWDASNDPAYLNQLQFDLRRASAHLYDFTDGQVALGDIYVTQNAERWPKSHILVHATNRLRPHATIGGVVLTPTAALSPTTGITYTIGQVHMGATWNRYGNPAQSIGVDWPVILAHELGHYLLFLEDTYLGLKEFDGAEVLTSVDSCAGSAMGDVYNINNTEFVQNPGDWQNNCADTLAAQELSRTEWDLITGYYPWLKAPRLTLPGPGRMPFDLTTVSIFPPITPANTLEDPTFYLDYRDGEVSSSEARAFLLRNKIGTGTGIDAYEYVYDLGNPVGGQNRLLARGAAPGDRLCVFDQARRQFGCLVIAPGRERLPLQKNEAWQPVVTLSPVNSTTFELQVSGVVTGLDLKARLYPEYGEAFTVTTLSPVDGRYTGTLALDYPALKGHVQLWVDNDPGIPRRETMVAYRVGGNPGESRGGSGESRGGSGESRGGSGESRGGSGESRGGSGESRGGSGESRGGSGESRGGSGNTRGEGNAPAVSPDGQMIYFDRNYDLAEGQFYTVQVMAGLPSLPAGKIAIGRGYNLFATGFAPGSLTGSVSFQYRGNDVLAEERSENELGIHFWDGQQWQALNTALDTTYNLASTSSRGPGIYALLAGVTSPLIEAVTPLTLSNNITNTLTLSGLNFLPPVTAQLVGTDSGFPLTPTAVTSATVTLAFSARIPIGSYRVQVVNQNQPLTAAATSAVVQVIDPAVAVCFADDFERGPGQWLRSGETGLIELLPGGNKVMAGGANQAATVADNVTSGPIDLSGCANPQLVWRYAFEGDVSSTAPVTLTADVFSSDTQSWQTLARHSQPAAGWQTATLDLRPYVGQTIRLRFGLGNGGQRWLLDDVVVRQSP